MGEARVVVVGLGPAGLDLMLPAAAAEFERIPVRFVRTARHPAAVELVESGLTAETFDDRYDGASDFDSLYRGIVETLVAAAGEAGEIVYAVPGNPGVAERTVALLRAATGVQVTVHPGLSFVDLAWTRLDHDPMDGVHVVDARHFVPSVAGRSGALLIGHVVDRFTLSEVKLALLDVLAADTPVVVLARLGLPDEAVTTLPLEDLDREVDPDHLTSIFVDAGERTIAGDVAELVALARRLRGPGGCPWDAAQNHHSLMRYLLEEAYEVVEVLEQLPSDAPEGPLDAVTYAKVEDELGDLLFQVVFHSILAAEAGVFDLGDVARTVHDKLVRRHPHVFGSTEAETPDAVIANWEQIKREERSSSSLVDGISPGLPSLLYAHKLYRKAASIGLDPDPRADGFAAMRDALGHLDSAADSAETEHALGMLLAGAVVVARDRGVDAESALRGWSGRFRSRFERMETLAAASGVALDVQDAATSRRLWDEASAAVVRDKRPEDS